MAARAGPLIPRSKIRPRRPTRGRARASRSARWLFSDSRHPLHVMAALVAAIQVFLRRQDVDARHKVGHDESIIANLYNSPLLQLRARAFDHVRPLGGILADRLGELLRAAAGRLIADRTEARHEGRR